VSGADDYLVRILVKDVDDYERVMRTQISGLPRVAHVQSDFAIRSIVSRSLPEAPEPAATRVQRPKNAKVGR
jgi:DNA-binding Lrp family transcriptional regulator